MSEERAGGREEELLTERRGRVRWVVFNRPEARNAMTWNMYRRLVEICESIDKEKDVRAMVLTGAGGKAFVAGTDISQFREFKTEQDALDYEARGNAVMRTLESVRVPVVASISGACTGAGASIAAHSDIRIATASARFGFPIARTLGNCLSLRNYTTVASIIGIARLKDIVLRARLMDAQEMLACGLVSEVVEDQDALDRRAQEIAEEMADNAPLTIWATKEALRRVRDQMVPRDADSDLIVACYMSRDFREGVEAFLAKRKPTWTGE